MEHCDAFLLDGVHESRCFRDVHKRTRRSQCVIHCRPADQIDPLTAFVLQELAAEVARALAKPFGRSVRNLKEPAPIDVRLEPVDDDLELSLHGQLRLLTSRPGPERPVSADSEAKRRVTPMSAS